jgi:hypothetical protein
VFGEEKTQQNRSRMQSRARYHEKGGFVLIVCRGITGTFFFLINEFRGSTFPLVVGEIEREERGEKGKKVGNWDTQGRMWELVHFGRQERGVRATSFAADSVKK